MNNKIKNATVTVYDNIEFKSKFELLVYITLKEAGFNVEYEPITFTLIEGFKPVVPFYDKDSTRTLVLQNNKVRDIRYTPDFYIKYNDINIYIEAKGFENDVFYIKKKLFRRVLDEAFKEYGIKSMYFEVYTKKNVLQCIDIIKNYVSPDNLIP